MLKWSGENMPLVQEGIREKWPFIATENGIRNRIVVDAIKMIEKKAIAVHCLNAQKSTTI